jgi:hypothetical protein
VSARAFQWRSGLRRVTMINCIILSLRAFRTQRRHVAPASKLGFAKVGELWCAS